MKNSIFVVIIIVVAGAGFYFFRDYSKDSTPEATTTIIMNDDGYSPDSIVVEEGTKITFKNEGQNPHWPASNFHPTHGIYPEFDPLSGIPPGGEWSIVLKPGKWRFHDHLYPDIVGTIEVRG